MTFYKLTVDFNRPEKFPLLKTKFGFFNSAYVPYDRWAKHAELLKNVRPAAVRYEVGWGMGNVGTELNGNKAFPQEYNAPQIRGSVDQIELVTEQIDGFVSSLNQQGIAPFLINCYNPKILQGANEDYTGMPKDLAAWMQINYIFAEHFKKTGNSVPFYEIWNEPDLDIFLMEAWRNFSGYMRREPEE